MIEMHITINHVEDKTAVCLTQWFLTVGSCIRLIHETLVAVFKPHLNCPLTTVTYVQQEP